MVINESLCDLEKRGFVATNFKDYKKLVRYGRYVCADCGRVARKKKNLCNPKRLYPKDKVVK
jgi:hypothetical protein